MNSFDVICIGAGPTGLACAIEAKRAGFRPVVIDKGCLCNSLYHYPSNMQFFTTAERMEIGDLPMTTAMAKPTRPEALKYYRRAADHYGIETRLYQRVSKIDGHDGAFVIHATDSDSRRHEYHGKKVIIATGYYDLPNRLEIPGEDLPFVSHYFTDPHPYWEQDVVVIGAKNSAAEAALELFRAGARVTLVHRGATVGDKLKYWVKPDIENRIRAGEIKAQFNHRVTRFEPGRVYVEPVGAAGTVVNEEGGRAPSSAEGNHGARAGEHGLPAVQVFALTGYHPDFTFLLNLGIHLDSVTKRPEIDPDSLETNVPGIHLAGVVVGGRNTSDIFIENGRFHGKVIIAALTGKGRVTEPAPVSPPGE
ncbi:MAG TPA: YpdA family putative bacillithiol disulfide reductase [Candidatus Acidoferrales bacterium]|nr:YpdA family putative bacillithiol disulfide reductase [Candidatus Acidoferrales bacterium]